MSGQTKSHSFGSITEWIPHVLIIGGLLLEMAGLTGSIFIWLIGFFLYGLFGIIRSIRQGYHTRWSAGTVKLIVEALMVVLVIAVFFGNNTFIFLLMLLLLDRLLLARRI
jgi:uncharacterized membrane protein YecN with MAPEG domain